MSMPPSNISGLMGDGEDAIIDAEIDQQLEIIDLENINDNDDFNDLENEEIDDVLINEDINLKDAPMPIDLEAYFNMVQQQSQQLEDELKACDDVLNQANASIAVAPVCDVFLEEEAKARGLDPLELQKQILADLEKDEEVDNENETNERNQDEQALVLLDENMLRKQEIFKKIKQVDEDYKEKKMKWIEEYESKKLEEEKLVAEKEEKRFAIRQVLQLQENDLNKLREEIRSDLEKESDKQKEQFEQDNKRFQAEMCELEQKLEEEKNSLNEQIQIEQDKRSQLQLKSSLIIQKSYRGYRVRKEYSETMTKLKIERKEKVINERIKTVEKEMKDKQVGEASAKKNIEEEEKRRTEEKRLEEEMKLEELKRKQREKEEEERKAEAKRKEKEMILEEERKKREEQEKLRIEKEKKERERIEKEEKEEQRMEELRKEEEQRKEKQRLEEECIRNEEEKRKSEEKLKEEQKRAEEKLRLEEEERQKNLEIQRKKEEEEKRKLEEKLKAVQEKKKVEEEKCKIKEEKEKKEAQRKEEKERKEKEKYNALTQGLSEELEARRLIWIKDCLPWSKISNEPWKLKADSSKKPPRRPHSAKKLPPLDDQIILASAQCKSLKQVTTVELHDLPGCSINTLSQCWGLQYLTMTKCNLITVDGISQCKQLQYLNVQDNMIEYVDIKELGKLQVVNLSHNKISTIHGLDGCMNIRYLDLSHNNINRIGGLSPLRRLHTLLLNNNQLLNTKGLNDIPTLQILNISNNHIQFIEDIKQLCLLQKLHASSNNIQQIPDLSNCVLLDDIDLSDNSISDLSRLSALWLPLLQIVHLDQNSIEDLPKLDNLFLLNSLFLSNNQIIDPESINKSFSNCKQLKHIVVEGNPAFDENNKRGILKKSFPRLCKVDNEAISSADNSVYKPVSAIETMCCYQATISNNLYEEFTTCSKKLKSSGPAKQSELCQCYYTYCDKSMQTAVEFRYAHEYGDINLPTPPQQAKSSQSHTPRIKSSNPKDMFEKALQSSTGDSLTSKVPSSNPKDLFDGAVQKSTQMPSNPKDLFEQGVKNAATITNPKDLFNQAVQKAPVVSSNPKDLFEKAVQRSTTSVNSSIRVSDSMSIDEEEGARIWMAAIIIQAAWRGYIVRRNLLDVWKRQQADDYPEEYHRGATLIQALWRGYRLRCRLFLALEYAQHQPEEDMEDLPDFDMNEFNFDEDNFDMDWRPADTPQFPQRHAILGKPPSGKRSLPPIPSLELETSPPQPKHAWRNMDSPLSDIHKGRQPRPPSSLNSTILHTNRSHAESHLSKKSEKLSEEWGFKDSRTAELMLQRAKKMKYNAQRKKKLGKLDPKQRLALFRKLEETAVLNPVTPPVRHILPRKEYFQAKLEEIHQQERAKSAENRNRVSRTYEWLHTQVGHHDISSPTPRVHSQLNGGSGFGSTGNINKTEYEGRWKSMQSPGSVSLQNRRHSFGDQQQHSYWGKPSVLPPIKTTSAPSIKLKEKMSWRKPELEKSIGWGGGKKRTSHR